MPEIPLTNVEKALEYHAKVFGFISNGVTSAVSNESGWKSTARVLPCFVRIRVGED